MSGRVALRLVRAGDDATNRVDPETVDELRALLAMAEEGRIKGFLWAYPDGNDVRFDCTGGLRRDKWLAARAAAIVKIRLIHDLGDPAEVTLY